MRSTVHDDHSFALAGAHRWGNAARGALEALHPLHDARRAKLPRLCCLRPQISAQQQLRRQAVDNLQLEASHLGPRGQHADATGRRIRLVRRCGPWTSTQQV